MNADHMSKSLIIIRTNRCDLIKCTFVPSPNQSNGLTVPMLLNMRARAISVPPGGLTFRVSVVK